MSDGAVSATRGTFGRLPDGREVASVTLAAPCGIAVTLIAYGATLQSVLLPDRAGRPADVTLGHRTIDEYLARRQFLGATCGRYANRIANGRFTLDGHSYRLPANDGNHALHGGPEGFDRALWEVTDIRSGEAASVTMRHVSPDGDQGFPGALTAEASYRLDARGRLAIEYRATADRPTVVALTNHAYWNLGGEGSGADAMDHLLAVAAEHYLPTDATAIPTGERRPVADTPFDFRTARRIGDRVDARDDQIAAGHGYDHCYVLGDGVAAEPRPAARLVDPASGRGLELLTDQPGLQCYSGNFLDGESRGKSGRPYPRRHAVALEPQALPDTPNRPDFGSARLAPGEAYRSRIVYRFFVEDNGAAPSGPPVVSSTATP